MITIKRYPNRKLYNTYTKKYIKLDGLARLIRTGAEIQVIDNATGEDLTTLTLTQIILEDEKKQSGVLTNSALTGLIRAGGDRLSALQRGLLTPLGLWAQVDEELKRRIETLVHRGEIEESEGETLLEKLIQVGVQLREERQRKAEETLKAEQIASFIRERQLPTQSDIKRLSDQLAELEDRLEALTQDSGKAE
jgi:polyhydroxyalkanoate synthesis repressor PhaR